MRQARLLVPEWAVCPLEYGDRSGITEREEAMLDAFIEREGLKDCWFDWDDQHEFSWKNDVNNEGGMCVPLTVYWR